MAVIRNNRREARHSTAGLPLDWAKELLYTRGFGATQLCEDYEALRRAGLSSPDAAATIREAMAAARLAYGKKLVEEATLRASDTSHPDTGRIARVTG